jgi:hypothetical protein
MRVRWMVALAGLAAGCESAPTLEPALGVESRRDAADVGATTPASSKDASPGSGDDGALEAASEAGAAAPKCNPAEAFSPFGALPSIPEASFARFGGIGADELSVAFTTTSGGVLVADRAVRSAPFAPPQVVDTRAAPLAADRVALSASGTWLVGVAADRGQLVGFERSTVGGAWSLSVTSLLANVNAIPSETHGALFYEPALGADGVSLYALFGPASGPFALLESRWSPSAHAWMAPAILSAPALTSADATHRRRPTGASSDGLTLFFFDETVNLERAAWRASISSPFAQFIDIGVPEAAPNKQCSTLYFQGTDEEAGVTAIFTAD